MYRLAFAEETRAPVEVHMSRPTLHVFTDLVALDALRELRDLDKAEAVKSSPSW